MRAAGLELRRFGLTTQLLLLRVWLRQKVQGAGLLPLGAVGEKSFSDPTSDTWKNKRADIQWTFLTNGNQMLKSVNIMRSKRKKQDFYHLNLD